MRALRAKRLHLLLIPVAAFAIVLPLLTHGCSCGHDFSFHIQSWLEAAEQFRHGDLHPHWAFSAAYNAGEPRFVFYPPLSWTLGALLTLVLPIKLVTTAYTFLALTAAGLSMHRLARHFAGPQAAFIATIFYIANPYMLFTAFERTAFAELLAAAWLPLLFLAVLRKRPTIPGIALPIALLWLTNAPAAVMGCYAMAIVLAVRLLQTRRSHSGVRFLATAAAGTALGLCMAAFYLVPAAYERRFVQIAMAIIPNMRFEDNFLFGQTADLPHNIVLHTASVISVELLAATAISLGVLFLIHRKSLPKLQPQTPAEPDDVAPFPAIPLAALALLIALLLTPISTPIWRHLPELAFLQFPWRLMSVLAVCLALATALILAAARRNGRSDGTSHRAALRLGSSTATALVCSALLLALVGPAIKIFRQPCEPDDLPAQHAQLFAGHHGVGPTDEYTPNTADNDVLRSNSPAYWLSTDPAAFAPGTIPNPASLGIITDDAPPPAATLSAHPATHFTVSTPIQQTLILNLRDYPNWQVTDVGDSSESTEETAHIPRDDGLIAIPLPTGESTINITWRRSTDETVGDVLTLFALGTFALLCIRARSRRIEFPALD